MNRRLRIALATVSWGLVTLAAPGGDAVAATQMFKCVIGGRTIYQQQACSAEAELPKASAAAAAGASAPAAAVSASPAASVRKAKPASRAASSVPATPR
jgi:hypothetical protein